MNVTLLKNFTRTEVLQEKLGNIGFHLSSCLLVVLICKFQANEQGTMNPINILKYGAEEEKSESARMVSCFSFF